MSALHAGKHPMSTRFRIIEATRCAEPPDDKGERVGPEDWVPLLDDGNVRVVARNQELNLVDMTGNCIWPSSVSYDGVPKEVHASADRLLVLTHSPEYHAWGFLGPALLLRRDDGSKVAELRGERGLSMGGGRFLLGLEGYDVFDTWLYDPDGGLVQHWRSYGHYTVDPDDSIRVIECDRRTPTRSRVVRLMPDGSIQRGPELRDGQASSPVVLEDGTLVFVDSGMLRTVDLGLRNATNIELSRVPASAAWRFKAKLTLDDWMLNVEITERSEGVPIEYTLHRWVIEVQASEER